MYKIDRDSCEIQPWKYMKVDDAVYDKTRDDAYNFTAKFSPQKEISYLPRQKIMTKKKIKFQGFYQRQKQLVQNKILGTIQYQFCNSEIRQQLIKSKPQHLQPKIQQFKNAKVSRHKKRHYSQQKQANQSKTITQKRYQRPFIKSLQHKNNHFNNLIIKNVQINLPAEKLSFSEFIQLKKLQNQQQKIKFKNTKSIKILYTSKQKNQIKQKMKKQAYKRHQVGKSLDLAEFTNNKIIDQKINKKSVRHRCSLSANLLNNQGSKNIDQKRRSEQKLHNCS